MAATRLFGPSGLFDSFAGLVVAVVVVGGCCCLISGTALSANDYTRRPE
jgi:hypothetical protein